MIVLADSELLYRLPDVVCSDGVVCCTMARAEGCRDDDACWMAVCNSCVWREVTGGVSENHVVCKCCGLRHRLLVVPPASPAP